MPGSTCLFLPFVGVQLPTMPCSFTRRQRNGVGLCQKCPSFSLFPSFLFFFPPSVSLSPSTFVPSLLPSLSLLLHLFPFLLPFPYFACSLPPFPSSSSSIVKSESPLSVLLSPHFFFFQYIPLFQMSDLFSATCQRVLQSLRGPTQVTISRVNLHLPL